MSAAYADKQGLPLLVKYDARIKQDGKPNVQEIFGEVAKVEGHGDARIPTSAEHTVNSMGCVHSLLHGLVLCRTGWIQAVPAVQELSALMGVGAVCPKGNECSQYQRFGIRPLRVGRLWQPIVEARSTIEAYVRFR